MALARIGHPCDSTAGCRATRRHHWSTPRKLAEALGVGKVFVKDESSRLGLPAFKVLGASWAVYRALEERLGEEGFGDWEEIGDLEERLEPMRPLSLVAATDGNHGRAVARVARLLGLGAKIFVPGGMALARREAIAEEGAEVIVVDGTYDEAVELSAAEEGESTLLVSDMSWPGYERIPLWVIEGYSTMLWEIDDELKRRNEKDPTSWSSRLASAPSPRPWPATSAVQGRRRARSSWASSRRAPIVCWSRSRPDASCPCQVRTIPSCRVSTAAGPTGRLADRV